MVRQSCASAGAGNVGGAVLNASFYVGFRFQITSSVVTKRIGASVTRSSGDASSMFAALVRLTSGSDDPDTANLMGMDRIATTVVSVPAGTDAVAVSNPITVTLEPGWYAAVFGTGAFGASTGDVNARAYGNIGCNAQSGTTYPFSIRQSDGLVIAQAASLNLFVEYAE